MEVKALVDGRIVDTFTDVKSVESALPHQQTGPPWLIVFEDGSEIEVDLSGHGHLQIYRQEEQ